MGFEVPETVYQLDFSDTQYAGLEAAVRATTVDELLHLQELMEGMDTPKGMRALFGAFADILVSWNATKRSKPVPPTLDGLLSLEDTFVTAVILAWQRRVVEAPPPLPGTSNSGKNSPEALLAAASRSASPPS